MLRFLSIRNVAVIDALEVEFEPGLNVLTGETGAGKSIVIEAVALLGGGRASADLVRTGEDTASVQAIFEASDGREILVRREISAQGRSRAFVDGALATTAMLKEICEGLVDLHGQHDQQALLDPGSHLGVLDVYANVTSLSQLVEGAFSQWRALTSERQRLLMDEQQKVARLELAGFHLAEIEKAAPGAPTEDEDLAVERQLLANADKLARLCVEAYESLYDGENAALAGLGVTWKKVSELAAIDARFRSHADARDAIKSQLEDLAFFLRSYASGIDASPQRLQAVEDRLALLERLKKKHGPTLADVVAKRERLRMEIEELAQVSSRATQLDEELGRARNAFLKAATQLSEARREAAVRFSRALERSLAELSMAKTRCEVRFGGPLPESQWSEHGFDQAELYISPNPGEEVRPLARIASGGELSRVMLALKTLASTDAAGKTLIFDEVDAGIGGAVADVVGKRLQELGAKYQVLCITHLPQIAAYGGTHYLITKRVQSGRTLTSIAPVAGDAREQELARMIAGAEPTAAVRTSAREMLAIRGESEIKAKAKAKAMREVPAAPARDARPKRPEVRGS
ncbi:MAG TPA: DNA repair protein RecN [Vicinamibacterales bacterium]|jgi:DNA repair protein RecN (Recombination protein N)|nr:DNA repair protein RecN [Vicinamibacterales bacterium]